MKFASAAAIEREAGILKELTFAGLKGIARGYGNWLVHPFNAITMQYYETNVASMVYLRGPMQWKCVAEMGKDIVRTFPRVFDSNSSSSVQISTLRDVHRMGIIHGDVKPGNIVTTTTAQSFYLIDWGYARRKSELVPDYPVGTPAYMSLRVLTGMRTLYHTNPSFIQFTNAIQRTTNEMTWSRSSIPCSTRDAGNSHGH